MGQKFVQGMMDKERPEKVSDIIDLLTEMPEYEQAMRLNNHPEVFVGERGRKAGRVLVKYAGGTAGPKEMYEALGKAGVGTIVCMHVPESHLEEAKRAHINVIVAGHMASDSVGLNLLADKYEELGVKVTTFSGMIRAKRS